MSAAADAGNPAQSGAQEGDWGENANPLTLLAILFSLAIANFMALLDTSIANVALPHITGSLGATPHEGTSVITFFAVAEAVTIPLTGWLAKRFGSVRVFLASMAGFGLTSAMCGLATSLPMLIGVRVLQGLAAGPMMPLSQSLLTQIMPKKYYPVAISLWTMTVVIAPITGPLLGGNIADSIGWEWAFYINLPPTIIALFFGWRLLMPHETPTKKEPVDFVGLALLILWVGALQIVLDTGAQRGWFEDPMVFAIGAIGVVGFLSFLIWELTAEHPIVDLTIFRHPSFTAACVVMSLSMGAFYASVLLVPLWLQTDLGYTGSWAGNLMAFNGVLGLIMSPIVGFMLTRVDGRLISFIGLCGISIMLFARTFFTDDMQFSQMLPVHLLHGAFMPMFFVPLVAIALSQVPKPELPSASGFFAFSRTLAGAIGASVAATMWTNSTERMHAELSAEVSNGGADAVAQLQALGLPYDQALARFDQIVNHAAVMLATNHVFSVVAPVILCTGFLLWLTPKPDMHKRPAGGGH